MRYKTIIFDLDGTLLDTLDDLADSVNHSLRKYGFTERRREEVMRFLGNGIRNLVEKSVPMDASLEDTDSVFEEFKTYYLKHCEDKTKPYDGIMELLKELDAEGFQMAIVSNKADRAVKELAEKYFEGLITVAIGERADVKRKPEPDSVLEAMRMLQADKESSIYVGDSEVDRATARNAGLPCISVTWGFRSEELLRSLEPEFLIHKPEEILKIVDGSASGQMECS